MLVTLLTHLLALVALRPKEQDSDTHKAKELKNLLHLELDHRLHWLKE